MQTRFRNLSKPLWQRVSIQEEVYYPTGYSKTPFKIRLCSLNEVDDLVELQKASFKGVAPWTKNDLVYEISRNPFALFYIVYDQDLPVAMVGSWFYKGEAHISNIATRPSHRRIGLGTYLIGLVVRVSQQEAMDELTLEVRASNVAAQNFYYTLGFVMRDRTFNYYAEEGEDAINMAMKLKSKI